MIKGKEEIRKRLLDGNKRFASSLFSSLDTNEELRHYLTENGQHPYALVLACSDSRVNPEAIFSAGLGELFVVRSAGQAILVGEYGSIAYGIEHLHIPYVLVLGHTHCGAIDSVLKGAVDPVMKKLLGFVSVGVGRESDPRKAEIANVRRDVSFLKRRFPDVTIEGAIYDIDSGFVTFLD